MDESKTVIFEPDGRRVVVAPGVSFMRAAAAAGIDLEAPCGGTGVCGKCKIVFATDAPPAGPEEDRLLTAAERESGTRLACRQVVTGDCTVTIPATTVSLVSQILQRAEVGETALDPAVRKVVVVTPAASESGLPTVIGRLARSLEQTTGVSVDPAEVRLAGLRTLAEAVHRQESTVTAVLVGDRMAAVESGDTTDCMAGLAVDIGTTTVVAYLVDLNTGAELACAAAMNPQMQFGDDVVSRIEHCRSAPGAHEALHLAIVQCVNELVGVVCESADIPRDRVYDATFAGNTCMVHLFAGVHPGALGEVPFTPPFTSALTLPAAELGLAIHPGGQAYVLPCIAGFVGADTVAMMLAHCPDDGATRLAVDIGTNGECVLQHQGQLYACSAAAGPAFEGARISCGMRGAPGAIAAFDRNGELRFTTVDDQPARGLCGSGLLDAVAVLLETGVVNASGRFATAANGFPQDIRERLVCDEEPGFVLVHAERTAVEHDLTLTQKDVRELQLAKGSIRAAANALMHKSGVAFDDLDELLLAGGFGNYLRVESAVRVGLLPPLPAERIRPVGNAAGAGAKLALLSRSMRRRAEQMAATVDHLELSTDPVYHEEFMETMMFP